MICLFSRFATVGCLSILLVLASSRPSRCADMTFLRVDSSNQRAESWIELKVIDWCTSDPTEEESTPEGSIVDEETTYATLEDENILATTNCSSHEVHTCVAENDTPQLAYTYTPNVTAGSGVQLTNIDNCDCEFQTTKCDVTGIGRGLFQAQQSGIVYSSASMLTAKSGDIGIDGGTVIAPNIYVGFEGGGSGYVVNGYVIDDVANDEIEFDSEWWPGSLNVTFTASMNISQNETFNLMSSATGSIMTTSPGAHSSMTSSAAWCFGEQ